jgi:hypothetical protein
MPPANGDETTEIPAAAAYAGFRTISLGYVNNVQLNSACGEEHDDPPGCYDDTRYELLFGEDRSDIMDVSLADAAVTRLAVALAALDDIFPKGGWGRYLDASGAVRWEDVVVGGWSAGSGNSAYLAGKRALDGVLFFSGPQDIYPNPKGEGAVLADWLMEERATPGCVHFGVLNTEDHNEMVPEAWDFCGLPDVWSDVDRDAPPYGDAHRLTTSEVMVGCDAHQSIGRDDCVLPEMMAPYLHMMCTAAATDPATCD